MQLPATLTLAEASAVLAQLRAQLEAVDGAVVEIDAAPLADFDTSAIAVLLDLQRAALSRGKRFVLAAAPPKLTQLADLYGVAPLLSGAAAADAQVTV